MIFHLTSLPEWSSQKRNEYFAPESLANEGFIHCCLSHQIKGVLDRYFIGQHNLLVLEIDPGKLLVPVKYEKGPNGDSFPHIYGSLPKDAIISMEELNPGF